MKTSPRKIYHKKNRVRPKKNLGQHFLNDPNLAKRIVRASGEISNSNIIEIGPGPGILTRALLEAGAKKVIVIEIDERFLDNLRNIEVSYPDRLRIISDDARRLDLGNICSQPKKIVANLPYNIGTALLVSWLKSASKFERFTLMFQKEVAKRLVAKPKTKTYGRLSILTQWLCEVKYEFDVPKNLFYPPPKVDSAVVSIIPRQKPLIPVKMESLESVTSAAFGQRRKMLRSSLRALSIDPENCGISQKRRAEDLSVTEFCALATLLETPNSFC